jgi:hypothetical protein
MWRSFLSFHLCRENQSAGEFKGNLELKSEITLKLIDTGKQTSYLSLIDQIL